MSVNILGLRFSSDIQKRSKNGAPPHTTTGVASAISIQLRVSDENGSGNESPTMAITRNGSKKAPLAHTLRDILTYSGSARASADTSTGSRAMPQIGQEPGP